MDPGHTASRFQTTTWTQIRRAKHNQADLAALLERYRPPVYGFLRRSKRLQPADANDLAQAFMCHVLENRKVIEHADPERGRFRAFLLVALKNYLSDEHRREHGRDGARRPKFQPMDPQALAAAEPLESDDPETTFDRLFASATLDTALRRVEEACRKDGMESQWKAFESRVLLPAKYECKPTPCEELMQSLGASRQQQIYSMVQTVKRKVEQAYEEAVGETVDDPAEVEAEVAELLRLLKR